MRLSSIILCVLLAACQTVQERPAAFQIGVTYAIQRYVYERPEDKQEATKARIRVIANDLKSLATGEAVTLLSLRQALDKELDKSNLIPPDRALVTALADMIVQELHLRVNNGALSPNETATVAMVLTWIEQAAA